MANISKSGIAIEVVKNGPIIHYLMFPDDCTIFYKANRSIAWNVKTVLKNNYNISGQVVNYHKPVVQ